MCYVTLHCLTFQWWQKKCFKPIYMGKCVCMLARASSHCSIHFHLAKLKSFVSPRSFNVFGQLFNGASLWNGIAVAISAYLSLTHSYSLVDYTFGAERYTTNQPTDQPTNQLPSAPVSHRGALHWHMRLPTLSLCMYVCVYVASCLIRRNFTISPSHISGVRCISCFSWPPQSTRIGKQGKQAGRVQWINTCHWHWHRTSRIGSHVMWRATMRQTPNS